jgi:hypothetical protein
MAKFEKVTPFFMKEEIIKALSRLIGLEFSLTTRAGDTECPKFGMLFEVNNIGKKSLIGEFGLNLQCPWRITKGKKLVVGYDDLYEQPDEASEYDENFNYDTQGGNLRDVKMKAFLKSGKYIVESVDADDFGGFELRFNDDVRLTVFPASACKIKDYSEHWRLLDNRWRLPDSGNIPRRHFVVSVFGTTPSFSDICPKKHVKRFNRDVKAAFAILDSTHSHLKQE